MATTLEQNTLEAQAREAGSKNDARKVRRGGKIPAVVYGAGKDSLAISVDPRHVLRILHSETGHNTIFDLSSLFRSRRFRLGCQRDRIRDHHFLDHRVPDVLHRRPR